MWMHIINAKLSKCFREIIKPRTQANIVLKESFISNVLIADNNPLLNNAGEPIK